MSQKNAAPEYLSIRFAEEVISRLKEHYRGTHDFSAWLAASDLLQRECMSAQARETEMKGRLKMQIVIEVLGADEKALTNLQKQTKMPICKLASAMCVRGTVNYCATLLKRQVNAAMVKHGLGELRP